MRVYRLRPEVANPSRLRWNLEQEPIPEPGPDEVRIAVRACSLNYRETIILAGAYGVDAGGRVPVSDGAGVVEAVGSNVTRWVPGDRVVANFFSNWIDGPFTREGAVTDLGGRVDGMLAERVVLPERALARIPDFLSFEEAACFPCAGLTAWNALFDRIAVRPGDAMLALGTGGVSVFAAQFALAAGVRPILTSRSAAKLARARELGIADGVDSTLHPEWDREVRNLTEGRGVDLVVEVGGSGTLERSIRCLALGGQIALIGVLAGREPIVDPFPLAMRNATLKGIFVGSRAQLEAMLAFAAEHRLRPVIDRVFPFDRAVEALEYLAAGRHFGKVVVAVDPGP